MFQQGAVLTYACKLLCPELYSSPCMHDLRLTLVYFPLSHISAFYPFLCSNQVYLQHGSLVSLIGSMTSLHLVHSPTYAVIIFIFAYNIYQINSDIFILQLNVSREASDPICGRNIV